MDLFARAAAGQITIFIPIKNDAGRSDKKAIVMKSKYTLWFCILYSVIQFYFAIDGVGLEGRGSFLLFSPFRFWLLGWFAMLGAILLPVILKQRVLVLSLILMCVHYLVTVSYAWEDISRYLVDPTDDHGLGRTITRRPELIIIGAIFYFVGQGIVWVLIARKQPTLEQIGR